MLLEESFWVCRCLMSSREVTAGYFLIHSVPHLCVLLVHRFPFKIYGEHLKIKLTGNGWTYICLNWSCFLCPRTRNRKFYAEDSGRFLGFWRWTASSYILWVLHAASYLADYWVYSSWGKTLLFFCILFEKKFSPVVLLQTQWQTTDGLLTDTYRAWLIQLTLKDCLT